MDVAISEAARRNMYVILYDEGMYPSGSSSGQVVKEILNMPPADWQRSISDREKNL